MEVLCRIATIMAAKGGGVRDIVVGDCLELLEHISGTGAGNRRKRNNLSFYQALHTLGMFPDDAPSTVRVFRTRGQLPVEELIDRYDIACRPVRDLLVDYLRERQVGLDHSSLRHLAYQLGRLFWKDLELHHPGIERPAAHPGGRGGVEAAGPGRHHQTRHPAPRRRAELPDRRARLLPGHRALGHRRPGPMGAMGGALPDPPGGKLPRQGAPAPEVPDGSAHPRADAGPSRPGRHRRPTTAGDRGTAGGRPARPRRARNSPAQASGCAARSPPGTQAPGSGPMTRKPGNAETSPWKNTEDFGPGPPSKFFAPPG